MILKAFYYYYYYYFPLLIYTLFTFVNRSFNVQHSLQASGSFDDASIITTKATSSSSFASSKSLIYGGLGDHIDSSSNEGDFVTYKGIFMFDLSSNVCSTFLLLVQVEISETFSPFNLFSVFSKSFY